MSDPIQPFPSADDAEFWRATARGELALCRCEPCAKYLHPPLERCPVCTRRTVFSPVSGNGVLYSYIVVPRAGVPGYGPGHMIGLVELVEQPGLRVAASLVDLPAGAVKIGMRMHGRIVDLPGGAFKILVFGPR